jgi:hypothetical protein
MTPQQREMLKARLAEIHNSWTGGLGDEEHPITTGIALKLMWEALDDYVVCPNTLRLRVVGGSQGTDIQLLTALEDCGEVLSFYTIKARQANHNNVYYVTLQIGNLQSVKNVLKFLHTKNGLTVSDYRFNLDKGESQ